MMKKLTILIILFVLTGLNAFAQVSVTAKIDSAQIKIGEQTKIRIEVLMNANQKVQFPVFKDTIVNNILLVSDTKTETNKLGNNKLKLSKIYTITSFDSALYYIPSLTIKVDNKEYKTSSLALKVTTVPVDTVHADRFYGEKPLMKAPFVWSDWIGMIICSFLTLIFIALLIFFIVRLHDNKPIIRKIKIQPKLSPQQEAMNEIEEIKSERLSTKIDKPKEYYTRLTEAIRKYIKNRFGFNAMEMTSQEIIDKLMELKDEEAMNDLRLLFVTADLVKFAKHAPEINENDANLVKAVDFINQTKAEEIEDKEPQETEVTIVEKRSLYAKRILIAVIVIVSITIIGCLIYVGTQLHELLA